MILNSFYACVLLLLVRYVDLSVVSCDGPCYGGVEGKVGMYKRF